MTDNSKIKAISKFLGVSEAAAKDIESVFEEEQYQYRVNINIKNRRISNNKISFIVENKQNNENIFVKIQIKQQVENKVKIFAEFILKDKIKTGGWNITSTTKMRTDTEEYCLDEISYFFEYIFKFIRMKFL
jgi:signal recognition particle subunit SEC65